MSGPQMVTCDYDAAPHQRDADDRPCRNPMPVVEVQPTHGPMRVRDLVALLSGWNEAWQDAPVYVEDAEGKPVEVRRITTELHQPGNHPQVVIVPPGHRSWR